MAAASMSGCIGAGPPIGNRAFRGDYTAWICSPDEISEQEHFAYRFARPRQISEVEDELGESYDMFTTMLPLNTFSLHIDFDEVDSYLDFGNPISHLVFHRVITGSFDREDIIDDLEDEGFDDEPSHESFEIFSNGEAAVGVTDDTLVLSTDNSRQDAEDILEEVIDTKRGEADRYVDDDDSFSEITRKLGDGHFIFGQRFDERDSTSTEYGIFRDCVGSGFRISFDEETSNLRQAYVFEDESDVDVDDVEDYVEENEETGEIFVDATDLSVRQRGRSVLIDWTVDTDEIFG